MCVYEYIRARESEGKGEGREGKERRKEEVIDGSQQLETRHIYPWNCHPLTVNE